MSDAIALKEAVVRVLIPLSKGNADSVKWLLGIGARVRNKDIGRLKFALTDDEALIGIHDDRGYFGYHFKSKDVCDLLRLAFGVM